MEMVLERAKRFKRSAAKGNREVSKGRSDVRGYLSDKKSKR
jgi:hypothetical protein